MMNNNAPASTKRLILFIALVAANVIALVAGILLILPNLGKADETSAAVEETSGRERQTARPGNTATPKPEATPEATEPTPEALPEGALSIEDIMGVYEYLDDYAEPQAVQVREILGDLMIRFKGSENEYKYDPLSGVATYSYEDLPGRPNEITMLFEVDGGNMAVTIDTLHTHPDGSETRERYDGYRVDPPGVPDGSDEDQAPGSCPVSLRGRWRLFHDGAHDDSGCQSANRDDARQRTGRRKGHHRAGRSARRLERNAH